MRDKKNDKGSHYKKRKSISFVYVIKLCVLCKVESDGKDEMVK